MARYSAVVVGSGPNGLTAAVELARNGAGVLVVEANDTIGGGTSSAELTRHGFIHDVCSAIHPLGAGSPVFASLALDHHGLEWVHPDNPLAHPLDDQPAVTLSRSLEATATALDDDAEPYRGLMEPLVRDWAKIRRHVLGPVTRIPRSPIALTRFGTRALLPASRLAGRFGTPRGRALFGGLAAHSIAPLDRPLTSAIALTLGMAGHAVGWPMPRGGSQAIADALASLLVNLGGEIETGRRVTDLADLPEATVYLLDTAPAAAVAIAGDRVTGRSRRMLEKFRHGPGAFKVDWALDGPIPWTDGNVATAGTVHLGGTFPEIAAAEAAVMDGGHPDRPFVLLAQQSLFDPTRAPAGRHTAWAYCHVPHDSDVDMTRQIEDQVERFAPGFRDRILARHTMAPSDLERRNANLVGGDVGGGAATVRQLVLRPGLTRDPYRIGDRVFLCSASTPPGAGVHGMCGYHAARSALRRLAGSDG